MSLVLQNNIFKVSITDYDPDGNLTSDKNKNITSILYNHLNMPTKITVTGSNAGTLDYVYTADGIKLQKTKTVGGVPTTTDYAGNYVYENNQLQFFNTSEGYVEPDGSGGYNYVYSYTDHLGNVRLNYSDFDGNGTISQSEILKERNFYPFGLEHSGYNNVVNGSERNYKTFQGQEISKELGLNWLSFKYRNYDPAIGRFMSVDPLADIPKQIGMSPYSAMANNPIYYIDPDGRCFTKAENGDYVPCDEGGSGDTRTGAFGNSWTYGEDSWQLTNTNENPDYSEANQVTPTGELNYYEKRYQNHINEYGTKPPDYYLEYGFNYAKKFSKDLRSESGISDDLRKWIDETVVGLQVLMETGIQESTNSSSDNFGMQGNNKKFRSFAFDTHVPAYTQSGTIKKLSYSELFKIFKQVKPADMVKPDGIKQAIDIVPKLFE